MLSTCFNNLFSQLQLHRLNLDALLLIWLTLNDDASQDEAAGPTNRPAAFDASRTPNIPLNPTAISSLLSALSWLPNLPIRTWVLAFQTLTLLSNLKYPSTEASGGSGSGTQGSERSLATVIVSDSSLMSVLIRFLSGSYSASMTVAGHQSSEVSAVSATRVSGVNAISRGRDSGHSG